jgi:hypothetical protein
MGSNLHKQEYLCLNRLLSPSVSFEFGQENNNTMDAKSYGKLTVGISVLESATFVAPRFLSSHTLPVLGEAISL